MALLVWILVASRAVDSLPSEWGKVVDYPGGFTPEGQCVHICSEVTEHNCFGGEPGYSECRKKGNTAGDWDFLLIEQMFLPQYCRLLEVGVDLTVSHQNVTAYPEGTQCIPERVTDTLTLHGLWPEYFQGYPACCDNLPDSSPNNRPLDPEDYAAAYSSGPLRPEALDSVWRDATMAAAYQSLCNIFNHEWQKHGHCLGKWDDPKNTTDMAAQYFEYAVKVAGIVGEATAQIDSWAAEGFSPSVGSIRGLYPSRIELWCASRDRDGANLNRLVAIRTCWSGSPTDFGAVLPTDCFSQYPYGSFSICDGSKPVRLDRYDRTLDSRQAAPVLEQQGTQRSIS